MLSLLLIATLFYSCTKTSSYGTSIPPNFIEQNPIELGVNVPADPTYPLSGEVTVTVYDNSGASHSFTLDRMWPQYPTGQTILYVGQISTKSTTKYIRINYCSVNFIRSKVVYKKEDLAQDINLYE